MKKGVNKSSRKLVYAVLGILAAVLVLAIAFNQINSNKDTSKLCFVFSWKGIP